MKLHTSKRTWHIDGITLIPSDSIYKKLVAAIETCNLEQKFLQKETGHYAPILVDTENAYMQFCSF